MKQPRGAGAAGHTGTPCWRRGGLTRDRGVASLLLCLQRASPSCVVRRSVVVVCSGPPEKRTRQLQRAVLRHSLEKPARAVRRPGGARGAERRAYWFARPRVLLASQTVVRGASGATAVSGVPASSRGAVAPGVPAWRPGRLRRRRARRRALQQQNATARAAPPTATPSSTLLRRRAAARCNLGAHAASLPGSAGAHRCARAGEAASSVERARARDARRRRVRRHLRLVGPPRRQPGAHAAATRERAPPAWPDAPAHCASCSPLTLGTTSATCFVARHGARAAEAPRARTLTLTLSPRHATHVFVARRAPRRRTRTVAPRTARLPRFASAACASTPLARRAPCSRHGRTTRPVAPLLSGSAAWTRRARWCSRRARLAPRSSAQRCN